MLLFQLINLQLSHLASYLVNLQYPMGIDLASYVVQHPESVLHLCEFTCSPTSKTPESNQQQNPLFQQKSKMHSTAHKHHLHTKHPFAYPVLLPFPGGTLTEGFALVASVRSQRGLPWWRLCTHRGVCPGGVCVLTEGFTLVAYVGLSMASSPMKKSRSSTPLSTLLWAWSTTFADSLMAIPEGKQHKASITTHIPSNDQERMT